MNRKRVQMLRNMIAGIPAKRINLDTFLRGGKTAHDCRTVACIGGWASLYPPFIAQGLIRDGDLSTVTFAEFFDVPREIFASTAWSIERGTHKQTALRRLDKLLAR